MIDIKYNLAIIKQQIFEACQQSNRSIDEVILLAVSKTKPINLIEQAYQAGQHEFGESYVQEAIDKINALTHLSQVKWHFIGPIQSNKTKLIATHFSWVHSLDRIKIASRLNDHSSDQDNPLNVCLQVNISGEQSKSGVTIDELPALVDFIDKCEYLTLRGLMAIPEKNAKKSSYIKMLTLFNQLKISHPKFDTLSMGMSNDLGPAIANGSTMVRVGSAIFGQRE